MEQNLIEDVKKLKEQAHKISFEQGRLENKIKDIQEQYNSLQSKYCDEWYQTIQGKYLLITHKDKPHNKYYITSTGQYPNKVGYHFWGYDFEDGYNNTLNKVTPGYHLEIYATDLFDILTSDYHFSYTIKEVSPNDIMKNLDELRNNVLTLK